MLYGCFFIQSIKGKTCLCTEETPKIQFSRRTKSFQKNIFLYLRNIFHARKQNAFCFENTTYMRFVTFLGHESPAPIENLHFCVGSLFCFCIKVTGLEPVSAKPNTIGCSRSE